MLQLKSEALPERYDEKYRIGMNVRWTYSKLKYLLAAKLFLTAPLKVLKYGIAVQNILKGTNIRLSVGDAIENNLRVATHVLESRGETTFVFDGKTLTYFRNGNIELTERTIELPIILSYVQSFKNSAILEVGNVVNHYSPFEHDVLDKYEKGQNVINEDALTFQGHQKYDLIFSVSTIEHVGFNEKLDRNKIMKVIENLICNLKKGGVFIFTSPVGFNPFLDNLIFNGRKKNWSSIFMKKVDPLGKYVQVDEAEALMSEYNFPFVHTNVIAITSIHNE